MYDFTRLLEAGISDGGARQLRRISMTLHRWHELECGDGNDHASWSIARGKKENGDFTYDDDGKPFREIHIMETHAPQPRKEHMTVKELRAALKGVADTALVTFQGNIEGEEDEEGTDEPGHITCLGPVYSAWERNPNEFVLDCAITESE